MTCTGVYGCACESEGEGEREGGSEEPHDLHRRVRGCEVRVPAKGRVKVGVAGADPPDQTARISRRICCFLI